MREEFARLDLRLHEIKSRIVDLTQDDASRFLGFTFRRLPSLRGRWRVEKTPAIKQRAAFAAQPQGCLPVLALQPEGRLIPEFNPILRGWVNYFRDGNPAACSRFVNEWVQKKVRAN